MMGSISNHKGADTEAGLCLVKRTLTDSMTPFLLCGWDN